MANSYYKLFNNKLSASYKEKFITDLHSELKTSINEEQSDLYEMLHASGNKNSGLDINLLLKYYMLNQIMQGSQNKCVSPHLICTKNPNIKKDKNGNYYRLSNGAIERDENIISVSDDGSYIVNEKRSQNKFRVLKTYNINNQIISIQVKDCAGNVVSNRNSAAELIGLRREYKKKYKYSGYSGNSKDMIAGLKNMFSSPIETGYYMDFHCLFYRWQSSTQSFVRMFNRESDSPLLVDIEFHDNGTVIRQEYTGIV